MFTLITSTISFICLLSFFVYELNQTSLNSTIKTLLAVFRILKMGQKSADRI